MLSGEDIVIKRLQKNKVGEGIEPKTGRRLMVSPTAWDRVIVGSNPIAPMMELEYVSGLDPEFYRFESCSGYNVAVAQPRRGTGL